MGVLKKLKIISLYYLKMQKYHLKITNLFEQNIAGWSSGHLLKNELEVIGFYFSNHPVSFYPKIFS